MITRMHAFLSGLESRLSATVKSIHALGKRVGKSFAGGENWPDYRTGESSLLSDLDTPFCGGVFMDRNNVRKSLAVHERGWFVVKTRELVPTRLGKPGNFRLSRSVLITQSSMIL